MSTHRSSTEPYPALVTWVVMPSEWFPSTYTRPSASSPWPRTDASIASWAGGRTWPIASRRPRTRLPDPSSIPMANPCVFGRTAEPDSTSGVRSIIPRTWRLGRIGAEVDDAVSERGSRPDRHHHQRFLVDLPTCHHPHVREGSDTRFLRWSPIPNLVGESHQGCSVLPIDGQTQQLRGTMVVAGEDRARLRCLQGR